jgi:SAM-dependent methyltransferase
MRDYSRLDALLDRLMDDVYPEPISLTHTEVTDAMLYELIENGVITRDMNVLDVGCGQGIALRRFKEYGFRSVRGIGLGADVDACLRLGFVAGTMDQSFLWFPPGTFDLVWARHVLEHSIAPLLTLTEFHRVLKPGGLAYIEVPAPDTIVMHENNPNHYSVMGANMWRALFVKAGFEIKRACELSVEVPIGTDTYLGFVLSRPTTQMA